MPLETFVPPRAPDGGTTDKPEFKILEAEFGDGYTQAVPDGINSIRRILTLTWSYLTPAQAKPIVDFLNRHYGAYAFYYTPSGEAAPVKWTCKDYADKREDGGMRTVSATFRQSFNLAA